MENPKIKENTLTYRKDTDTYYFSITNSTIPVDENGNELEEIVFCAWLGNGDTVSLPISEIGEVIKIYDSYDNALPKINELVNPNLISGID